MENKNEKNVPLQNDDKVHIEKSVFQTAKDIQQQRLNEIKAQEQQIQKQLAEREKKRREAYDRKILEEKKELLRLKQGTIEESETIHEEKPEEVKLTFFQKIKNFLYHSKWWLGIATVFTCIGIFLIYNLAVQEHPDIVIMLLEKNDDIGYTDNLKNYVENFTEDFNDNGEILASLYYIPYTDNLNTNYANGIDTKLTVQLQTDESMIIIGGAKTHEIMSLDDSLVNLEEIFPDNPNIDKYAFYLKGSKFAEKLGISEDSITDDLFLAIRKPMVLMSASYEDMQKAYEKDFPVFEKIIEDLSE